MTRILGVGIAALDIINEVEGYPGEDQEVRAQGQRMTLGGQRGQHPHGGAEPAGAAL